MILEVHTGLFQTLSPSTLLVQDQRSISTLGALPTVTNTHIDIDLQRRDFSINAMAIAIHMNKLGLLLDPMQGLEDLANRQLQTLHGLSFLQDPTRIFKALDTVLDSICVCNQPP